MKKIYRIFPNKKKNSISKDPLYSMQFAGYRARRSNAQSKPIKHI